jgi:hypothetical protein
MNDFDIDDPDLKSYVGHLEVEVERLRKREEEALNGEAATEYRARQAGAEIEKLEQERDVFKVENERLRQQGIFATSQQYITKTDAEIERLRAVEKAYNEAIDDDAALRAEVERLREIRDLLVQSVVRATGADEDAVREAPLTCAIRHAEEVERLRAKVEATERFLDFGSRMTVAELRAALAEEKA